MLEELLSQRKALLHSPGLPLFLLRQHDRRLVLWCEQHPAALAAEAWGTLQAENQAAWLAELRLELVTRLGCSSDIAQPAMGSGSLVAAHWQLAAHFTEAAMPAELPEQSELQIWAAMALARREKEARVSPVWLAWIRAQEPGETISERGLRTLVAELWNCSQDAWRHWFYPLLLSRPEAEHPAMINWLAGQVDNASLVEAMGVSGAERFKPWLDELALQDDAIGAVANHVRHRPASDHGDMHARIRYWWPRWHQLEGSPWSLFGGRW